MPLSLEVTQRARYDLPRAFCTQWDQTNEPPRAHDRPADAGLDFANIDGVKKPRNVAIPTLVESMLPTLTRQPFSNPDWLFEPKCEAFAQRSG